MRIVSSLTLAAALMAAVAFAPPVHAQRLSLAERVTKLEQDAEGHNSAQSNIDLVNQINALQAQVQTLQGQIEELRHQVDESKSRSKDQYIDLDSRIARLEGRGPASSPPPPSAMPVERNNGQLQDIPLNNAPVTAPPVPAEDSQPAPQESSSAPPNVAADAAASPADAKTAYDQAFACWALSPARRPWCRVGATLSRVSPHQPVPKQRTDAAIRTTGWANRITLHRTHPISLATFQKLLCAVSGMFRTESTQNALLKVGLLPAIRRDETMGIRPKRRSPRSCRLIRRTPLRHVLLRAASRALKLEGRR